MISVLERPNLMKGKEEKNKTKEEVATRPGLYDWLHLVNAPTGHEGRGWGRGGIFSASSTWFKYE